MPYLDRCGLRFSDGKDRVGSAFRVYATFKKVLP